ncbi:biotin--[acetyl-CoA-carboxylase] ligase [Georgenia muralis]|uniref:biotin--[biotin carboxyl-carrier protein] ligase n=1 Tax=Georgenia muralis TaxID=154117 RepID=A0A3N4ZJ67_9MICO|nr:biotin--[acetyl-CoA-carboxylase] ligase [Georgenia muralis]RPF25938.1 BirA family biotin operon repressor/biotin-[acetyl-CoA-carboxylase] ligase [Georgenia muralis]
MGAMDDGAAPFSRTVRVARTGSTSTDLREAAAREPGRWPHLSVLVADAQDAGRGRAGRSWDTPPGQALTASVLVRPRVPAQDLAWVTLLTGLAVLRAVEDVLTGAGGGAAARRRVALKWPNDVVMVDAGEEDLPGWGRDRKVAGILTEVVPGQPPAVVLGIGVNVAEERSGLPVGWATSLRLEGAAATPQHVLAAVGRHLVALLDRWETAGGDTGALTGEVAERCATLGQEVAVDLPGGERLEGTATSLGADGALLVRTEDGREVAVRAGDVSHVRRR